MDIYKGEDETIILTITSENGVILDLSIVLDIVVVLYYKQTGVILNKYRKIPTTGFDPLTIVSGPAGTAQILLNRALTASAPSGLVAMTVNMQFTDAAFQAGVFDVITNGIPVGVMQDTLTNGEL